MSASDASPQPSPPSLRQCGRCRLFFPAVADLHPAERKEWWACNDCKASIIPSQIRANS